MNLQQSIWGLSLGVWLQWAITGIFGVVGFFLGKKWKRNDERNLKDRKTLERIEELFPFSTMIDIHDQNFGDPYPILFSERMEKLLSESKYPDFVFLNKQLEQLLERFISSLGSFNQKLAHYSGQSGNENHVRIPVEYDMPTNQERKEIDEIESLSNDLFDLYSDIRKKAHKLL
jgi:hypothetical protein